MRIAQAGRKITWIAILCAVLAIGMGITSMAAINIKIKFNTPSKANWPEEPTEPTVTVNGSEVSPEWSKDVEDWKPGKKVTATITIPGSYANSTIGVYGGEKGQVKHSGEETIVKATYIPVVKLGTPETAGWSDTTKTRAAWEKVPYATQYQLRIYRDTTWIKTIITTGSGIDLLEYMEDGHKYYYEVRAIAKSSENYLADGEFMTSDDSVVQELGDTNGRWRTYQEGKKYETEDGNFVAGDWKMVSGRWYYFDENGYALTGWQPIQEKWYYFNENTEMETGWQKLSEVWYYFEPDGKMATGWIQPEPGKWYYLNPDGSLAADTVVDGYHVDASGVWIP